MKNITSLIKSLTTPLFVTTLFIICFVTLIATALTSYQNLQKLKLHNEWMEHSWNIKDHLKNVSLLLMDAESGLRGYFLSDDPVFLDPYKTAKKKIPSEFRALKNLVKGSAPQEEKLTQLIFLFDEKLDRFEKSMQIYKAEGLPTIRTRVRLGRGKNLMDDIRILDIIMEKEALELLATRRQHFYSEYNRSLWINIAINLIAILILFLFYRLIHQNFRRQKTIENELKISNDKLESTVLARTEQLSLLSRHLIKISEEEKHKLARELHDEMGSNLTAINMDISITIDKLKKIDPSMTEQLMRAKQTLLDTVNLKRRIIEDMRPSMLDHLGLAASLKSHFEKMTNISNISLEMNIEDDFDYIDPTISIAIFRIAQESLNNIIKYSKATTVNISFVRKPCGLWLLITDNGIGIGSDISDNSLLKTKSHGLLGMRERALLLGGSFTIKSGGSYVGTIIETFIPFPSTQ